MHENIKATLWLLLNVVAIANGSVDKAIQTQRDTVDKDRDIPSKESLIAAKSRVHCASWCMTKDDCCSSVYDRTTGICSFYSCCSPVTTASLYQDVLKKQTTPGIFLIYLK